MQAITVSERDAGVAGLSLTDLPYPRTADNDVVVRVHAAGFTPSELDWPHTWIDRAGRDRTPATSRRCAAIGPVCSPLRPAAPRPRPNHLLRSNHSPAQRNSQTA